MLHAAMLAHGDHPEKLRAHLKECAVNIKLWMQKTELLLHHMRRVGWDVSTIPLDALDMRISSMFDARDLSDMEDDDDSTGE